MKTILIVLLAALSVPVARMDASEIYFPPEAAGGRISLWSSGALVFTGNGWGHFANGEVDLRLQWQDSADDLLMFMRVWTFDLPDGRFSLSAERSGRLVTFTLTREGESSPALRSPPFKVERWTRTNQEWKDGEPGATDNPGDAQ